MIGVDMYTTQEKVAAFDHLHSMARRYLQYIMDNGRQEKNSQGYIFEAVIDRTIGREVWEEINEILG